MKATGIIRRIDELGRIVIQKEIRRTLGVREGDPMEIYTDKDGGVIFKQYKASETWKAQIARLGNAIIDDQDIPGPTRALISRRISELLDAFKEGNHE